MSAHRFVRVQDGLHGAYADADGLKLPYLHSTSQRHTMHFAVDSIVGDVNGYGAFNKNPDGSLKGSIVFVADPASMQVPAGLNQVDTWFRMDSRMDDKGLLKRELNIGNATIVAPQGTSIPQGVNAVFYDAAGGIKSRDLAVRKCLEAAGVQVQSCNDRNWAGYDWDSTTQWAMDTASELYSEAASKIHVGMHSGSLDDDIESGGTRGYLASMKSSQQSTYEDQTGCSAQYTSAMQQELSRRIANFDRLEVEGHPADVARLAAFGNATLASMNSDLREAQELEILFRARDENKYILDELSAVPGCGLFAICKQGSIEPLMFTKEDLAKEFLNGNVSSRDLVWRNAMSPNWQAIGSSPLRGVSREFPLKTAAIEKAEADSPDANMVWPGPQLRPSILAAPAVISPEFAIGNVQKMHGRLSPHQTTSPARRPGP